MHHSNGSDRTFANIWTLDNNGYLDQLLFGWEIADTHEDMAVVVFGIYQSGQSAMMQGKALAIRFRFSSTNGSLPGEWAYFDDITDRSMHEKRANQRQNVPACSHAHRWQAA